jgi:hypothetical protein
MATPGSWTEDEFEHVLNRNYSDQDAVHRQIGWCCPGGSGVYPQLPSRRRHIWSLWHDEDAAWPWQGFEYLPQLRREVLAQSVARDGARHCRHGTLGVTTSAITRRLPLFERYRVLSGSLPLVQPVTLPFSSK